MFTTTTTIEAGTTEFCVAVYVSVGPRSDRIEWNPWTQNDGDISGDVDHFSLSFRTPTGDGLGESTEVQILDIDNMLDTRGEPSGWYWITLDISESTYWASGDHTGQFLLTPAWVGGEDPGSAPGVYGYTFPDIEVFVVPASATYAQTLDAIYNEASQASTAASTAVQHINNTETKVDDLSVVVSGVANTTYDTHNMLGDIAPNIHATRNDVIETLRLVSEGGTPPHTIGGLTPLVLPDVVKGKSFPHLLYLTYQGGPVAPVPNSYGLDGVLEISITSPAKNLTVIEPYLSDLDKTGLPNVYSVDFGAEFSAVEGPFSVYVKSGVRPYRTSTVGDYGGAGEDILTARFVSDTLGWGTCDSANNLLKTVDGGATWSSFATHDPSFQSSLLSVARNHVVGANSPAHAVPWHTTVSVFSITTETITNLDTSAIGGTDYLRDILAIDTGQGNTIGVFALTQQGKVFAAEGADTSFSPFVEVTGIPAGVAISCIAGTSEVGVVVSGNNGFVGILDSPTSIVDYTAEFGIQGDITAVTVPSTGNVPPLFGLADGSLIQLAVGDPIAITSPTQSAIISVLSLTDKIFLACSGGGNLYRTVDGGASWLDISPSFMYPSKICTARGDEIWVEGNGITVKYAQSILLDPSLYFRQIVAESTGGGGGGGTLPVHVVQKGALGSGC